jgi:hypothetical protein
MYATAQTGRLWEITFHTTVESNDSQPVIVFVFKGFYGLPDGPGIAKFAPGK